MANKTRKAISVICLLLLAVFIQWLILGYISKVNYEKKVQGARVYGNSIAKAIQLTLDNTLEASESLKYFYLQYGESCFDKFEEIAEKIAADNPCIASMYIAPKGVIEVAYPRTINESTIGFRMLEDEEQGARARLAMETGRITIAGPHDLVEGGVGFIIRNPVYVDGEFLGFTIIVLDWDKYVDDMLKNVEPSSVEYKYAVWKNDRDETAVTDSDGYILRNTREAVSDQVDQKNKMQNDTWHLYVEPEGGWDVRAEMAGSIAVSVMISVTVLGLLFTLNVFSEKKKQYERKQAENAAKIMYMDKLTEAMERAERANAAKTIFLNNMSHDIRTPMNAILGYTKLIKSKENEPEMIDNYITKIEKSGEYLLSIINNVLEVSRIDSGKETVEECLTDLMDESCSVAPLLEEEINKKKLVFIPEMELQHRYVFADMVKIREITMNLMSNAIKYTPEGGTIRLKFKELPSDREGYARYENIVSDTGIGISSDFIEHIFDSFSRERNTTESKIMGTGLGMSIVKKLVDLMGGTIEVTSEPGKGSSFKVTLYHRIVEEPDKYIEMQREQNSRAVDLKGRRILLVEDNELNAEIATELLQDLGAEVEWAEDGIKCIDMLDKANPGYYDLILMDVQMPLLNGYETTRRIREMANKRKAGIPIFAMTANAFEEDRKNAIDAGMNGHIAKPIRINEMLTEFAQLLK